MGLTEISTKLEELRRQVAAVEHGIQEVLGIEGLDEMLEATPAHALARELKDMGTSAGLITVGLLIERVALEKTIASNLGKPGGLDDQVKQLGWVFGGWIQGKWVAYLMSDGPESGVITKEAREVSGDKLLESIRLKSAGR